MGSCDFSIPPSDDSTSSEDFVPPSYIVEPRLYRGSNLAPTPLARLIRFAYPLTKLHYVWTRWEFPYVLNALGLVGEGVEVGVLTGDFSSYFLRAWKGRLLHSVDPWRAFEEEAGYVDIHHFVPEHFERVYRTARDKLSKYGERSRILREASPEAASAFADGQLDFVYIDAQHQYDAVRRDLLAWWPKVCVGGILAGHDYLDGVIPEGVFGVKSAVDEFAAAKSVAVAVSHEPRWKSYFLRKPHT